jgi:hypothetical protein
MHKNIITIMKTQNIYTNKKNFFIYTYINIDVYKFIE